MSADENEETKNLRARLRDLKSTFRYDYEDDADSEDTDDTSQVPVTTICCPLDRLIRHINALDLNKARIIVYVAVLIGLGVLLVIFTCLKSTSHVTTVPHTKTSVNLIFASSKRH